jgi:hypothetical protein
MAGEHSSAALILYTIGTIHQRQQDSKVPAAIPRLRGRLADWVLTGNAGSMKEVSGTRFSQMCRAREDRSASLQERLGSAMMGGNAEPRKSKNAETRPK